MSLLLQQNFHQTKFDLNVQDLFLSTCSFSEVGPSFDYTRPHLVFTNMGDGTFSADGCYSRVGRIGGGQVVNLGSLGCTMIGRVLHETLHALGKI